MRIPEAQTFESYPWTDERKRVCLEASWGLEASGKLLPAVLLNSVDVLSETMQVGCIAACQRTLASALMAALDDDMVLTADLAEMLGLHLEGRPVANGRNSRRLFYRGHSVVERWPFPSLQVVL